MADDAWDEELRLRDLVELANKLCVQAGNMEAAKYLHEYCMAKWPDRYIENQKKNNDMAKKPEVGERWFVDTPETGGEVAVKIMSFNVETAMCDLVVLNGELTRYKNYKCHVSKLHEKPFSLKQPPLGIHPKWLWEEQRRAALADAVIRYAEAGLAVPLEVWNPD